MALPNSGNGAFANAADTETGAPKRARLFLQPLDPLTAEPIPGLNTIYLQYWPESMSYDRGGANYTPIEIPGQSHPLLQWGSNGSPTLSFEAVFTRDHDPVYDYSSPRLLKEAEKGSFVFDVDIDAAIAWFAACTNPAYTEGERLNAKPVQPPPVIQVIPEIVRPESQNLGFLELAQNFANKVSGNTSRTAVSNGRPIDSYGFSLSHSIGNNDEFFAYIQNFSVEYTDFFPSGAVRIARVSIQMIQTVQIAGRILTYDRVENIKLAASYRLSRPPVPITLPPLGESPVTKILKNVGGTVEEGLRGLDDFNRRRQLLQTIEATPDLSNIA